MSNRYNNLRTSAQKDVCYTFLKLYPDSNLDQIHNIFQIINPIVDWDDDEFTGYSIWNAYKNKFEELLTKK